MKTLTRNKLAIFTDYVGFGLGLTFAQTGTVLPAFSATLTDSKILIGMASAVWTGSWLLPQLFIANYLTDKPNKYRYMVTVAAIGRPVFWIFALILILGFLANQPTLLLIIFLLGIAWFSSTDAVAAICWFDIFGRAMSPRDRGQLIGIGQVVNGVLAIGAGFLVGHLLSDQGLPYPYNYAAIFGLAGVAFFISWVGCALMVEVPEHVLTAPPVTSLRDYLPKFAEVWRNDPIFARVIIVRMLISITEMATPFYIIHATQVTKVGDGIVGSLAAVGSMGSALAGLWLGRVAARQGSHRVIQITSWLCVVPPILGLFVAFMPVTPALFVVLYIGCYLIIGMVNGSAMLGYFNYILDLAPPGYRPIYMGLANTLGGVLVFAPIIGGWILDYFSYPILFTLTLLGVAASTVVAMRLPPAPNHHVESAEEVTAVA